MKTHAKARIEIDQSESGQAAAVVALFLFFVFLALASLAIDGSMTYLARRDLQNVADSATLAACQVLANGGDSAGALSEAQAIIAKNLGSSAPFAGPNPPDSNQGSGSNLVQGIEVSVPVTGVRVALLRTVPTVLTQFLGRTQSIIDARAMCDSTAGGGLLPIAVQRYDYGGSWRDYLANKYASATDPTAPPVPYPTDSYTVTIPNGRYGPFDVPVPKTSPTDFTASDGNSTDMNTGPVVSLLGNQAETNDPPNSMSGLVLLDIRNVGAGQCCLEFYNGVDGQANTNKNVSQAWIYQRGYPGPYPPPGSQVAVLSGVSAPFGPKAMTDAGYQIGDVVAAIVYDGYVWTKPDFTVQLTPKPANPNGIMTSGYPSTPGKAVVYDLSIQRAGGVNAKWNNPIDFTLSFNFSEAGTLPPGTQVELRNSLGNLVGSPLTGVTEATGWTGTVSIYSPTAGDLPTQTLKYLSGLNVIADASTGLSHGAAPASGSINYGFGAIGADFAVSTTSGRVRMRQGDKNVKVDLYTYGTKSLSKDCKNAGVTGSVIGTTDPWGKFFSAISPKVTIGKDAPNKTTVSLDTVASTPTGSYTLRFTVDPTTSPGCSLATSHSVDLPLEISPAANSPTDDYVIIQGYALFRIAYMDPNDVKGYAISPLMFNYKDVKVGLRSRLVPWK